MNPRTHTPDEKITREDGSTTTRIRLKRACNGCGQHVGDADDRDVDDNGNLTDVRAECPNCRPLVELEAAGCKTWELTPRSFATVLHQIDQFGVFVKHFTEAGEDDRLTVVGMRVGERPGHVVARFGDWIIRHPDGKWSVHKGPENTAIPPRETATAPAEASGR